MQINLGNLHARALLIIDNPDKVHCVSGIRVVTPENRIRNPGGDPKIFPECGWSSGFKLAIVHLCLKR